MKTKRSRAYPAIGLREAVSLLERQVEELGDGAHERDTIARAFGYSNGSVGAVARKIAALSHFGLLTRQNGKYEPSELAQSLINQKAELVRDAAIREAFLEPALFRDVINKYETTGKVPRLLANALAQDHGITEKAMHHAAEVFMASAQYAGILAPDGQFLRSYDNEGLDDDDSGMASQGPGLASRSREPQLFRIYLTDDKVAELKLPPRLNEKDVQILKAQLTVFEQQVEANRVVRAAPQNIRRFPASQR